ncbi:hypothetical protein BY454_14313 [Marinobacter persicus]|jgi:hypothetical protein|uniref:Uncharacterized protein n=1 Tax=Marinobacter persicus TaxID=930118 RepID=A0A2S6G268_9GAMM|nr:hypothetical protein BY455_14213 [Marinobacter persicus]PPK51591.1 hypothetical protein B0H24_10432 [Marinobacter persicus]PPK56263.1 hypothetical protein BY454_14313 [Marinobacter persicus]
MDFLQVVLLLFAALWHLVLLTLGPALIKSTCFKDKVCNADVSLSLKTFLNIKYYNLLKNTMLPKAIDEFCAIPFIEGRFN